jgi:hypothetical protein
LFYLSQPYNKVISVELNLLLEWQEGGYVLWREVGYLVEEGEGHGVKR